MVSFLQPSFIPPHVPHHSRSFRSPRSPLHFPASMALSLLRLPFSANPRTLLLSSSSLLSSPKPPNLFPPPSIIARTSTSNKANPLPPLHHSCPSRSYPSRPVPSPTLTPPLSPAPILFPSFPLPHSLHPTQHATHAQKIPASSLPTHSPSTSCATPLLPRISTHFNTATQYSSNHSFSLMYSNTRSSRRMNTLAFEHSLGWVLNSCGVGRRKRDRREEPR